ncbi:MULTISPECIES: BTAD domain-containing putative transcriptional regulator [unclassified Mesorhizobium]|uniref:BTAD domain-containing putative transcriptional regulator n=1 Tax=unclassified Mesorhizobium TaxID=325217 RepID=UPI000BAF8DA3|nr:MULTISPECIES: BTAD domain-containing putative transcriptional regulator [unclassified Mesorhizobium]PBC21267.1 hypothetical protein CK226_20760 [Mesorhizobium sp. WSM4311]TRD04804.1 hypothetical protein FJV82_13180 [Mesorhizobium sp. WSM4305]
MASIQPENTVSFRLFGFPQVGSSKKTSVFPSRGFCLLALLCLAPVKKLTRARVAAQLWDSADSTASLGNLRQLLLRMQKALPDLNTILAVDDKSLWLTNAAGQIDVCRFLELGDGPADQTLLELVALYRGDFLEGLAAAANQPDDALAIASTYLRERYFALVQEALKALTRYGTADLTLLRAVERHSLSIDNAREDTYRALIMAYGAIGRPEEARRIYGLLASVLNMDGADSPVLNTRVSLAHATARLIDQTFGRPNDVGEAGTRLMRVALLAPNWASRMSDRDNFLRALVEDIANELARYKSHLTLAPHSSFQVMHDGGVLQENSLLRADYTVSSFVRPAAGPGTLCVRLVHSDSGAIVWAGDFALQHEVLVHSSRVLVARIAAEVSGAVESDSLKQLERTGNASSYLHFLRAQSALKTCDLRSVRRARRSYANAIKEDGRFAEAYSGVSCSLYLEWLLLGGNDPKLLSEARELADQAIRYDPNSSSGHWRKAMVALYQHDFAQSEQCFHRARDLHPNSADILLDHSDAMGFVGDANDAWRMYERAIDLNPTPPDHYWWAGASIAFSKADYFKAIELCSRLDHEESVLRLLAACHGQLGNVVEAREYGHRLMEMYPGESAESMTRLQPHRSRQDLQPFIDGLRLAGIK